MTSLTKRQQSRPEWVSWFRHASPYINAHRGQVNVIALSGDALMHDNLENIIHDLALMSSLGMRLIIVFGARPQIDEKLRSENLSCAFHKGLRVTEAVIMSQVMEAYGRLRTKLEALFSTGIINSPMHGAAINVVSGNFVMAKPIGVLEGVDLCYTGQVRKINSEAILRALDTNEIVLLPALGYSVAGDTFNLAYEDLASELAASVQASKLIFLGADTPLSDKNGEIVHHVTAKEAMSIAKDHGVHVKSDVMMSLLHAAARACNAGVKRAHLLSYCHDGALLEELFTRDGIGTLVSVDEFDQIRPARLADVNGILELIQPLEEQGFLVRRSRELLETELDYFLVEVRDNAIIGCAALYPFPADLAGELSCFAVSQEYRREGRGDSLLNAIQKRAVQQNFKKLFVLTTKTEHWFKERGFGNATADDLPGDKAYNVDRNAKVLVKTLNEQ